jgi:DNA helicase-2/ATP-dependent DNA helicase PcrA
MRFKEGWKFMPFDFGNANDQQREAIKATDGPLLIIAGRGTGKTFTLVKRIIYLKTEKGVQPEEIMVATLSYFVVSDLLEVCPTLSVAVIYHL